MINYCTDCTTIPTQGDLFYRRGWLKDWNGKWWSLNLLTSWMQASNPFMKAVSAWIGPAACNSFNSMIVDVCIVSMYVREYVCKHACVPLYMHVIAFVCMRTAVMCTCERVCVCKHRMCVCVFVYTFSWLHFMILQLKLPSLKVFDRTQRHTSNKPLL